jgi:hypothetical protein
MSDSGCACKNEGQAGESAPAPRTPRAVVSERTIPVWDPLALAGSTLQVSAAFRLGGANALEFTGVGVGAGGAIQTDLQAQVSNDGINWSNAGSSVQLLAIGNTASPVITGLSARYFRITAQNQTVNAFIIVVVARLSC